MFLNRANIKLNPNKHHINLGSSNIFMSRYYQSILTNSFVRTFLIDLKNHLLDNLRKRILKKNSKSDKNSDTVNIFN
jgi:hypothetical protein